MDYPESIKKLTEEIIQKNSNIIAKVAEQMQSTVDGGGLVYVFGSGHSSLFAEEAFHRAGGLVPVYPILHQFLSPHCLPKVVSKVERLEGIAKVLFDNAGVKKGDFMWIASNSGINAAAIEMALCCQNLGIKNVALTSLQHSMQSQSRHSSQKRLFELSSFVLDNCCPKGDAIFKVGSMSVAASSTIANSFLYHWVLTETCKLWERDGKKLPIYQSVNIPGNEAYNEAIESQYRERIPLL